MPAKAKDADLFLVQSQGCLSDLPEWLSLRAYDCSFYGGRMLDTRGKPMIGLKLGENRSGLIIVDNRSLFDETLAIVLAHQRTERIAA